MTWPGHRHSWGAASVLFLTEPTASWKLRKHQWAALGFPIWWTYMLGPTSLLGFIYFYLQGRLWRRRDRSLIPQRLGRSEARSFFCVCHVGAGAQVLGLTSTAFPGTLPESWSGIRVARIQISVRMGYWHHSSPSLLQYDTSLSCMSFVSVYFLGRFLNSCFTYHNGYKYLQSVSILVTLINYIFLDKISLLDQFKL